MLRLKFPRVRPWISRRPGRRRGTGSRGDAEAMPQATSPGNRNAVDWPQVDQPIKGAAGDCLDRGPFVERVKQLLDELHAIEESSVVTLVGPWGSGKSSVINLILERMRATWQVCTVNTWAPPDVSALLAEFFGAIRSVLPQEERNRQLGQRLNEYAQLAIPALGAIPMFGSAAQGVAENIVKLYAERPLQYAGRWPVVAERAYDAPGPERRADTGQPRGSG
jgi:hypothetical protein